MRLSVYFPLVADDRRPSTLALERSGSHYSPPRSNAVGLAPVFGCRSGICGTCATRINSGAVDYIEEPLAPRGEGQVVLCCSVPAAAGTPGSANLDLVLDL